MAHGLILSDWKIPCTMKKKSILFVLAAICLPLAVSAQKEREITLNEAIAMARMQSVDAAVALNELKTSYWEYRTFRADLLPEINLNGTLPNYNKSYGSYQNPDGSYSFVRNSALGPVSYTHLSGCGKSTLLNIMGLLDAPTTGTVEINGTHTEGMKDKQLAAFRNKTLGFVFQSFHLINSLNVMDNVELPLLYRRISSGERKCLAKEVLEKVGLSHRMNHFPTQLSGGKCQRCLLYTSEQIV